MLRKKHFTFLALTMGGIVLALKRRREIIAKLKKCNYYHEKGHWVKECEKKKEDKKEESFVNLIETSGFVTSVGYAIATSHGPTHKSNIHDWILDVSISKHVTDQKDWFSSLTMIEPNTRGKNLANNQKF